MSTNILTQIRFKHVKGASLLHSTDFSSLRDLGLSVDIEFGNLWRLDIDTIVTISSKKYKITRISTLFYNEIEEMGHGKGVYSGEGDPLPYNFSITYYVENI